MDLLGARSPRKPNQPLRPKLFTFSILILTSSNFFLFCILPWRSSERTWKMLSANYDYISRSKRVNEQKKRTQQTIIHAFVQINFKHNLPHCAGHIVKKSKFATLWQFRSISMNGTVSAPKNEPAPEPNRKDQVHVHFENNWMMIVWSEPAEIRSFSAENNNSTMLDWIMPNLDSRKAMYKNGSNCPSERYSDWLCALIRSPITENIRIK